MRKPGTAVPGESEKSTRVPQGRHRFSPPLVKPHGRVVPSFRVLCERVGFPFTGSEAFDLARITNNVRAPSFAHFAKGGDHERIRNAVSVEGTKVVPTVPKPALAKTASTRHPWSW